MIGELGDQGELFQCTNMEALVPAGHELRRLNAVIDDRFVCEVVGHLYSDIGRPAVHPSVVLRMWILQHRYGLSERRLCEEVQMHAGYRWFCGLTFNDPVPDQSTLVKLRTRMWAGTNIWEIVLRMTVAWCEKAGLPPAELMAVDGTQIRANASLSSMVERPPELSIEAGEDASADAGATGADLQIEAGGRPRGPRASGDARFRHEKFSNATHTSTTDPDARLARKGRGMETHPRFLGHYMADVQTGVIYGAMATCATGFGERDAALALMDKLPHKPRELVADAGYRGGAFLADVMSRGVQPLVPLGDGPLEAIPEFTRPAGTPEAEAERQRARAAAAARNATRLATRRRGARTQRQRIRIEHLFAEAKQQHGLSRARGRGLTRVDQQVKLTAAVQNLKRLLNMRPQRATGLAAGCVSAEQATLHAFSRIYGAKRSRFRRPISRYGRRSRYCPGVNSKTTPFSSGL